MPARIRWSTQLVDTLTQLRSEGLSIEECADHLGFDAGVVHRKAQELGINGRMNRGYIRGSTVVRQREVLGAVIGSNCKPAAS